MVIEVLLVEREAFANQLDLKKMEVMKGKRI